jgi:hypothetical protein
LAVSVLVVLLVSVGSPFASAADGPVAPERSDYAVLTYCQPLAVPVPLTSTSPSLVPGDGKPVRVSGLDEVWASSVEEFFTAEVMAGGRTIVIHLGRGNSGMPCAKVLPLPGTYHLVVTVAAVHADRTTSPASVAVDITVPAATLSGTSDLAIQQYVTCPFNVCLVHPPDPKGRIILRDSSVTAAAAGIRIGSALDYSSDQPVIDPKVTVTLTEHDITIEPGQQGAFDVAVSGDLPPGTTKARAEIVSPEAPSGLSVSVTVTRRQSWIGFGLVLLAGLILGVLTRKILTRLVDTGRRRRRAEDVITRLRAQAALTADPTLREQLTGIAGRLGPDVRAAATPEAATQVIEQAEKDGEAAVADLASRLARAVNERDIWSAQLEGSAWSAQVIGSQLTDARAAIAQVDEAIRARNAVRASQLVDAQRTETAAAALGAAQNWTDGVRDHLSALDRGQCRELLPAWLRTRADTLADRFDQETVPIRGGTIDDDAHREMSNLQTALNKAAGIVQHVNDQLRDLGLELEETTTALVQRWGFASDGQLDQDVLSLHASPGEDAFLIETLGQRTELACASVGRMHDFLARGADDSHVPPDQRAAYDTAVDESDYGKLTALATSAAPRPRVLGAAPGVSAAAETAGTAVYVAAGPADLDTTAPPPDGPVPGPSAISTTMLTALRWGLLAGTLTLAAWFVLPRTMVGTPAQLAGLFFWAFSIDLAFEALTKVAAGWASGPSVT